jgi:hypothetical protein
LLRKCTKAGGSVAGAQIQEYAIWLVHAHMMAVSPWRQRLGASSRRTGRGASALLPQRTSSVTPRSRM